MIVIVVAVVAYLSGDYTATLRARKQFAKANTYNAELFEKMKAQKAHLQGRIRLLKMESCANRHAAQAMLNGADPQEALQQHYIDVEFLNLIKKEI